MARDSRQMFYYHNKVVLRALMLATLAFVSIAVFFWWRSADRAVSPSQASLPVRHFTDGAVMAEVTRQYAYGARYIHDIERYPEISDRFFGESAIGFSSSESLETALQTVREAHRTVSEGGKQHVYYTSYYIGNLLVLPGITLHEQLLSSGRLHTATLLETALADVRAGAIKVAMVHDVAPPYFYEPTLAGAVYYPSPSSPSLTVSEVATVFYMLAEIDPDRARVYEQQLAEYAEQTLASGAHFESDIQAALDLARMYHHIMVNDKNYQSLIEQAQSEWVDYTATFAPQSEVRLDRRFSIRDFPYQSSFFIDRIERGSYTPRSTQETLTGSLFLTLADVRIPDAGLRMYEYAWDRGAVLPIALDLQPRLYPFLRESVARASYLSKNDYFFITNTDTRSRLVRRYGETVTDMNGLEDFYTVTTLEARGEMGLMVLSDRSPVAQDRIHLIEVKNDSEARVIRTIDEASSPTIVTPDTILFIDNQGGVRGFDPAGQDVYLVPGIEPPTDGATATERRMAYFRENNALVVLDITIDPATMIPETVVTLYGITVGASGAVADRQYSATLVDTRVSDGELSPGGRYVALLANEALGGRGSKILIFDIMNGIIKEEIDISDFVPSTASLDGWLVF